MFFCALLELLPAFQKQYEKCKKQLPIGLVLKLSLIVIRRDYIGKWRNLVRERKIFRYDIQRNSVHLGGGVGHILLSAS